MDEAAPEEGSPLKAIYQQCSPQLGESVLYSSGGLCAAHHSIHHEVFSLGLLWASRKKLLEHKKGAGKLGLKSSRVWEYPPCILFSSLPLLSFQMLGFPGVSFLTSSPCLSRKTREIGVHKARRRREIGGRWWSLNVTVGVSGENRRQTQGERQKTLDEGTLDRIVARDGGSTRGTLRHHLPPSLQG